MAAAAHMDLVCQFMDATTKLPVAQRLLMFVLPLLPLLLLLLLRIASRSRRKQAKPLPPSPPGLPVLGHLLHVGAHLPASLRDLAARHGGGGGLMLLRLDTVPSLVVSSPRAAEAVLRTQDHAFASRPPSRLVDNLVYGSSSVGFAPYGEHWRRARKLVTVHLLTANKVRSYRAARQEEARLVVAKLREAAAAGAAGWTSAAR